MCGREKETWEHGRRNVKGGGERELAGDGGNSVWKNGEREK